jgi:hypothetical protein
MTKGDLDTITIAGRPMKPVAMGITLTMVVVASSNWRGFDRGTEPPLSYVVAALATTAIIALLWGWFGRNQRAAEIGLLLVVAAYSTRAAFVYLSSGLDQAVYFSLASVIIAGGSYLLEASSRRGEAPWSPHWSKRSASS